MVSDAPTGVSVGVSDEGISLRDVWIDDLEGTAPGPQQDDQANTAVDRAADGHRCDRVDDLAIDQ